MRKTVALLCVTMMGPSASGYQYWNDIRHSALLPDNTVEVRVENPVGGDIQNFLLYAEAGVQEEPMTPLLDGPSTVSAIVPGPTTETRYYGFRLIQDTALDLMPARISADFSPQPQDLSRLASDVTGDELFGYVNLDLTDCHVSFSDERFYTSLQNAGGGFPTNEGFTFFGYLLGITDPSLADPDTVWGLLYTFEQQGVIGPGLYRIEGSGFGDLTKIGEIEVQVFPATNTLMMSCLLADLLADPHFMAWYDQTDPTLGVAAFTQKITLTDGAAEADRSPGGSCYLRDFSIAPGVNQLPELSNADFEGVGSEAFAEIDYTDANGNCPVLSEIVFDESLSFPLFPLSLEYDSPVIYRTDTGIGPLVDDSWQTALFRFSDNQEDVVEHEVEAVGIVDTDSRCIVRTLSLSNAPNPFSAATTIEFCLPEALHVQIGIFDASGAPIFTVVDKPLAAGKHELHWEPEDCGTNSISSGTYFVRVHAGRWMAVKRMLLLR